jgi:hypothetical protein
MKFLRSSVLVLAALAVGGSVFAQNLITNPNFDTDISSWLYTGTSAFSTQDAEGSPASGSVAITNNYPSAFVGQAIYSSPCVAVTPGDHYSYGGKFLLPTGQESDAYAETAMELYSDGGCTTILNGEASPSVGPKDSWQSVVQDNLAIGAGVHSIRIGALIATGNNPSPPLIGYFDDAFLIKGSVTAPCVADDTTLCLHAGRYKVNVQWRTHSDSGAGHGTSLTDDSGDYWFFDPTNVELIIKAVSACVDPFNRYWVFLAGLTNVEVTVTVVDTHTGQVRTYVNPLDRTFVTVLDTNAFATCP